MCLCVLNLNNIHAFVALHERNYIIFIIDACMLYLLLCAQSQNLIKIMRILISFHKNIRPFFSKLPFHGNCSVIHFAGDDTFQVSSMIIDTSNECIGSRPYESTRL